jgi:outer membrane protein
LSYIKLPPLDTKNDGVDTNVVASVQQPLFNLEGWYRLKEANTEVALAQLNYRGSEQVLLLRVAEAYFSVLGARDGLRTASSQTKALARQLELAHENVRVGLSTVTDYQDVQARYDLSAAEELRAQEALTEANETMMQLTKVPSTESDDQHVQVVPMDRPAPVEKPLAALREDTPLPRPDPGTEQSWVGFAQIGNLDVIAARLNFKVAAESVKATFARHLPTVSLSWSDVYERTEDGAFPTTVHGPALGLNVTMPIFSGGAVTSQVRQAEATRDQRGAEVDATVRQAERDLRVAFERVTTDAAQIKALKIALASSVAALDAAQTGVQVGTRSTIDMLNAQQQRYVAERDSDQTRYEYILALLRLKALAGELAVHDLQEIDALLAAD